MAQPPASPVEARQLVDKIIQNNGFVRESTLEAMPPAVRREVEKALLAKDQKIGSSVLTLAKNLYTSKARFVVELLQNAEDNTYSSAQAAGADPFVSFCLYHDRLVVDCNEDGFTEANLTAICDVRRSSRAASQGSNMGEKGIGFKSVFTVAWKFHIQSGHLSFSFSHRNGESGMGMVRPRWEEPEGPLPKLQHTRITLFLHEERNIGKDQARRDREDIRAQLRDLDPAFLLFASKLKKVEVIFHDCDGKQEWATRLSRRQATAEGRVVLERRVTSMGRLEQAKPERHTYHVVEHIATNVAEHDNKESTGGETANPAASQSKIVLAFPISESSVPVIKPQKVFATLPIREIGFKFLIQADFVTQANREDVVTSSARNKDLLRGIVDATIKAIRQLCEDKDLQYTWMRYLPLAESQHWDPFWRTVVDGIKENLQQEPVVRTRGHHVLRRLGELRYVMDFCRDELGEPIFPDLEPEIYLSDLYESDDIGILAALGLPRLSMENVLATVRRDLAEAQLPFQDLPTQYSWQDRAFKLLLRLWSSGREDVQAELKNLPLIPLDDGSWARAVDNDLFYQHIDTFLRIPPDLGLSLVAEWFSEIPAQWELTKRLGVRQADTSMVRSRILDLHAQAQQYGDNEAIGLGDSLDHLRFLYLTHGVKAEDEPAPHLVVADEQGCCRRLSDGEDFYIRNSATYGASCLLSDTSIQAAAGAAFLHPAYFYWPLRRPVGTSLAWRAWLLDYVGVRRKLRLVSRDQTSLSPECKHIAEHHNTKLLGFLRHVWREEGDIVVNNESIREELMELEFPCKNGQRKKLAFCFMPLEGLKSLRQQFADEEVMCFLDLEPCCSKRKVHLSGDARILWEWSFLTNVLGVSFKNDLHFRLQLLLGFLDRSLPSMTMQRASKLLELYRYVGALATGDENSQEVLTTRDLFRFSYLLVFPSRDSGLGQFQVTDAEECLWDAPKDFSTKWPLKALYRAAGMGVDDDDLRRFFQHTLGIPNVSHEHIIAELQLLAASEQPEGVRVENVLNLYRLLQGMHEADPTIAADLQSAFATTPLIYTPDPPSWHHPTACIWSEPLAGPVLSKISINAVYPTLATFFTTVLDVPLVTVSTVYDSLLSAASTNPTPEKIRPLLETFNALLPTARDPPKAGPLVALPVFPVTNPDGTRELVSPTTKRFFVPDRADLLAVFGARVRCLDFSLAEACRMRPFLEWAGLRKKGMSRAVREESMVGGAVRKVRDARREVGRRGFALLRIAAKFASPRYAADAAGLYALLRGAETLEAERISSLLVLWQAGVRHDHSVSQANLHIVERQGALKIYIPQDEAAWDDCFLDALPRRLTAWLMEPAEVPDAAVGVVMSILNCSEAAIPSLLERKGVPEIDEVEVPVPEPLEENSSDHLTDGDSRAVAIVGANSAAAPHAVSINFEILFQAKLGQPRNGGHPGLEPSRPVHLADNQLAADRAKYRQLLDSVIAAAARVAQRDYASKSSLAGGAFNSLNLAIPTKFMNSSALRQYLSTTSDRDQKVGAAGELFVFELLSHLIPSLDPATNWPSNLRHYANAHPKYADLVPFTGREATDLVYDDTDAAFTNLLVDLDHLPQCGWEDMTPRYLIEVKTTTNECEAQFYVSPAQAEMMLSTTNGLPHAPAQNHTIYALFRVFNLGTPEAGVRIYLDPAEQRRTGALRFMTTDKYAVIPG